MTQAPIATVAALRETSIVFAALIGALFLKEGLGRLRLVSALLVCTGAVVIKLGAMLNKSPTRAASSQRAVCGVANPRHSGGYGCGLRLASHPDARRSPSPGPIQHCLISGGFSRARDARARR